MHLLRCVHAAHRLIMAFCHIKELTTQRRGGASHHARRDRVRFSVFSRLCKEEFVHDLENLMKVMEDSRGRANSRASSFFHPHRVRPRNRQARPESHGSPPRRFPDKVATALAVRLNAEHRSAIALGIVHPLFPSVSSNQLSALASALPLLQKLKPGSSREGALQALQGDTNENSNMGRIKDCILAERSKERAA